MFACARTNWLRNGVSPFSFRNLRHLTIYISTTRSSGRCVPVYVPRRRNCTVNHIPASRGPAHCLVPVFKVHPVGAGQVPLRDAFALLWAGRIFCTLDPTIKSVYCGSLRRLSPPDCWSVFIGDRKTVLDDPYGPNRPMRLSCYHSHERSSIRCILKVVSHVFYSVRTSARFILI